MRNTEQLENALKMLREADRDASAPDFLETRLRAAFREHHAAKKPAGHFAGFRWVWVTTALAGFVVGGAIWRVADPGRVEAPPAIVKVDRDASPPTRFVAPPPAEKQIVATTVKPSKPVVRRREPRVISEPIPVSSASTHETQDFIAIPYAPPFTSQDRGEVIRTRLSRQAIRSLGIPVNTERMFERLPADILIGEDGVARGIRLVPATEPH